MTYKKHLREEDLIPALPEQAGNENGLLQTNGTNLLWSNFTFNILAVTSDGVENNISVHANATIPVYTADGVEHQLRITL